MTCSPDHAHCTLCGQCLTCSPHPPHTRAARLESYRRYNRSAKGQARDARYEAKHPERKLRWEPARNALQAPLAPPPDGPMP